VLKLEISFVELQYLEGFLVSCRGMFLKIIFLHGEIFESFHTSSIHC
jgi:hypothetical protein